MVVQLNPAWLISDQPAEQFVIFLDRETILRIVIYLVNGQFIALHIVDGPAVTHVLVVLAFFIHSISPITASTNKIT